jgi:hypothetical protein
MNALFLFIIIWTQGIPVQPTQAGSIAGVLKDSAGKPAAGIRVAAVARPDSLEEFAGGAAAMSSIDETDEQGRFTLENVPPGRYFIAAGVLNFPTYYPGTQAMAEGKTVLVTAGGKVTDIDFALRESSGGRVIGTGGGINIGQFTIPLDIRAEGGAKIPIFGGGKPTGVRVEPVAGGTSYTASVIDGALPMQPINSDYRVIVEGLPEGYSVKSIKYGGADVNDGILKINATSATANSISNPLIPGSAITVIRSAGLNVFNTPQGSPVQVPVPQTLSILLTRTAPPKAPGVSITGQLAPTIRGLFLSGVSATIYRDYSFELPGVKPGHYVLSALSGNLREVFAASIIVGDRDVSGIELERISVLPLDARTPTPPSPAGNRAPGRLPLAVVRGKILDSETGEPITQGDVFLVGDYWTGRRLTSDGKFEFPSLLPGKYKIEVKAVGYPTFQKEFSIGEEDLELEVKSN